VKSDGLSRITFIMENMGREWRGPVQPALITGVSGGAVGSRGFSCCRREASEAVDRMSIRVSMAAIMEEWRLRAKPGEARHQQMLYL
jgi:hypothetical protein